MNKNSNNKNDNYNSHNHEYNKHNDKFTGHGRECGFGQLTGSLEVDFDVPALLGFLDGPGKGDGHLAAIGL